MKPDHLLLLLSVVFFLTVDASTVLAATVNSVTPDKEAATHKPVSFAPYNQARILFQEVRNTPSYKLALSPYVKRENVWRTENFLRLRGVLNRQTHELPKGLDEQEVFEFYRDQLPENREILFTCERRGCGESNNWANDHFGIKQLYGFEQYQFYGVYQVGQTQFYTLYAVRRGNGRIYVQLEHLQAE